MRVASHRPRMAKSSKQNRNSHASLVSIHGTQCCIESLITHHTTRLYGWLPLPKSYTKDSRIQSHFCESGTEHLKKTFDIFHKRTIQKNLANVQAARADLSMSYSLITRSSLRSHRRGRPAQEYPLQGALVIAVHPRACIDESNGSHTPSGGKLR